MNCPHCAETIKPEALVCPHCRHRTVLGKQKRGTAIAKAIGIVFLVAALGTPAVMFTYEAMDYQVALRDLMIDARLHNNYLALQEPGYQSLVNDVAREGDVSRAEAARFISSMLRTQATADQIKKLAHVRAQLAAR